MKSAAAFAAGVVTGWIARSTVDTSRDAFVKLVSLSFGAAERARRIFALEREWLDDLVAEARTRAQARRPRASHTAANGGAATPGRENGAYEHAS